MQDRLAAVSARQDGVIRRDQLTGCGLSQGEIAAQLDARRWQEVGSLVVVLHNGPLTERQEQWAAVLNAGPEAALCGRTAAAAAGLEGWPTEAIHVLVNRGRIVRRLPGISVYIHESRRFSPEDVHPSRLPPQTGVARSVIDAATWTRRPRAACGLLAAAVQQRLVLPDQLVAELELAGKIRHHRIMRTALVDIGGGAQAISEIDLARICRRYGLPEPERQRVRLDGDGRRRYLDAVLRAPSGLNVVVEVDGAIHLLPDRYWSDMSRDNEGTIAGERLLRFPTIALRLEEERVADQLARALGLGRVVAGRVVST